MIILTRLDNHLGKEYLSVAFFLGPLAQSVEQQTFNLWVVGSIPTGPTNLVSRSFHTIFLT